MKTKIILGFLSACLLYAVGFAQTRLPTTSPTRSLPQNTRTSLGTTDGKNLPTTPNTKSDDSLPNAGGNTTPVSIRQSLPIPARHGGDYFDTATTLTLDLSRTPASASDIGSNVNATREPNERYHSEPWRRPVASPTTPADYPSDPGGKSIWWKVIAPNQSGTLTIDTDGSDFDTVLAVYFGSSVSGLTPVAGSRDTFLSAVSAPRIKTTSKVTFDISPGAIYNIAVDGYNGASGKVALKIEFRPKVLTYPPNEPISKYSAPFVPSNDYFADAFQVYGDHMILYGNNIHATSPDGEYFYWFFKDIKDIEPKTLWWKWTAPSDGTVTLSTEASAIYATVGAFVKDYTDSYQGINGAAYSVLKNEKLGTEYGNYSEKLMSFSVLKGKEYYVVVDGGQIDIKGSGKTKSFRSTGSFVLKLNLDPYTTKYTDYSAAYLATDEPPVNDVFEYRVGIQGVTPQYPYTGVSPVPHVSSSTTTPTVWDNTHAVDLQPGEPPLGSGHSVVNDGNTIPEHNTMWWTYTPTYSGTVTLTATATETQPKPSIEPVPVIGVYTGATVDGLTLVNQADGNAASPSSATLSFMAQAGVAYQINVSGNSDPGTFTLRLAHSSN